MLIEIEVTNPVETDYTAKVFVPAEDVKEISELQRIYRYLLTTKPLWWED